MNWEKIKWFYEACSELNISKTAKRLNLSQPALSRHVRDLEHNVGYKLFNRSHSGLSLTPKGFKLFDLSKEIAEKMQSIEKLTMFKDESGRKSLKIETSVTLATMWFPHYVPNFIKENPEIQLDLDGLQDEEKLLNGKADVAISTYIPNRTDLVQESLMTFHLGLYASPDYLEKQGTPLSIEDLKHHKFISYGKNELHQYGIGINALFENINDFQLQSPIVMNMGTSIVTVASKGIGIIVLSSEYPGLPESNLVHILPQIKCEVEIFISFPREKEGYSPVQKLKSFLKKELTQNNENNLESSVVKLQNS